jgi:hypothetical protein
MGGVRRDREYRLARAAYVAAVNRLGQATTEWEDAEVPLVPGPGVVLPPWSTRQIRATVLVAVAWQDLVAKRRDFEPLVRELPQG